MHGNRGRVLENARIYLVKINVWNKKNTIRSKAVLKILLQFSVKRIIF